MEEYYTERGAELDHDMLIEFESESINLRIDKEGVITKDQVWKIIPLTYPPKVVAMYVPKKIYTLIK